MTLLQSRWFFFALQLLDLLTTLLAFHYGAFEINPIVARLTIMFGKIGGVVCGKLIAVFLAMGVRKRLWIVNLFYIGVVCWNVLILYLLSMARP